MANVTGMVSGHEVTMSAAQAQAWNDGTFNETMVGGITVNVDGRELPLSDMPDGWGGLEPLEFDSATCSQSVRAALRDAYMCCDDINSFVVAYTNVLDSGYHSDSDDIHSGDRWFTDTEVVDFLAWLGSQE